MSLAEVLDRLGFFKLDVNRCNAPKMVTTDSGRHLSAGCRLQVANTQLIPIFSIKDMMTMVKNAAS